MLTRKDGQHNLIIQKTTPPGASVKSVTNARKQQFAQRFRAVLKGKSPDAKTLCFPMVSSGFQYPGITSQKPYVSQVFSCMPIFPRWYPCVFRPLEIISVSGKHSAPDPDCFQAFPVCRILPASPDGCLCVLRYELPYVISFPALGPTLKKKSKCITEIKCRCRELVHNPQHVES